MIVRIDGQIYLEVADNADLEGVAQSFDGGFREAVRHFPDGDVVQADVTGITKLDQAELEAKGFVE